MKAKVIKEMTTEEIVEKLSQDLDGLTKMKLSHAVSPLENPMLIGAKRRDIARLKTELHVRKSAK